MYPVAALAHGDSALSVCLTVWATGSGAEWLSRWPGDEWIPLEPPKVSSGDGKETTARGMSREEGNDWSGWGGWRETRRRGEEPV